jgi:hypothetical protein
MCVPETNVPHIDCCVRTDQERATMIRLERRAKANGVPKATNFGQGLLPQGRIEPYERATEEPDGE